eukprot:scpid62109/ scgid10848/ 
MRTQRSTHFADAQTKSDFKSSVHEEVQQSIGTPPAHVALRAHLYEDGDPQPQSVPSDPMALCLLWRGSVESYSGARRSQHHRFSGSGAEVCVKPGLCFCKSSCCAWPAVCEGETNSDDIPPLLVQCFCEGLLS